MPTLPRRSAALGLSLGVLAAFAMPALADAPDPGAALVPSLEALDAPDFETRDRASEELNDALVYLRTGPYAHAWHEVERGLVRSASEGDLSIEARVRLLACLKRQFMESARAAIGISFNQHPQEPRQVVIMDVRPGFPAGDAGILKIGDVMLAIDGVPISGAVDFMNTTRTMICSRDPGDVVKITLLRKPDDGAEPERLTLDVPLGSFDLLIRPDLPRADQIGRDAMEAAWRVRLERLGWAPDAELAVLPAALPAEDWHRFERIPRGRNMPRIDLAEARPGAEEALVAQLTNGAVRLADAGQPNAPDQLEKLRLALGGERNGMRRLPPMVINADDPDQQLIALLNTQLAERLQAAQQFEQQLNREGLRDADRTRLKAQYDAEIQAISSLRMQLSDIAGQIRAQQILRERRLKQQP